MPLEGQLIQGMGYCHSDCRVLLNHPGHVLLFCHYLKVTVCVTMSLTAKDSKKERKKETNKQQAPKKPTKPESTGAQAI